MTESNGSDDGGGADADADGDENRSRAVRQGSSSLRTNGWLMIGQVRKAISAGSRSGSDLVAAGGKCRILRFHESYGSAPST